MAYCTWSTRTGNGLELLSWEEGNFSGHPMVDEQLDQSHAWPHPMGLGLPESLSDTQRQHQQWLVQAGQQGPCGFRFKPKIETKMLPKFLLGCWRASVTFVLCQVDW